MNFLLKVDDKKDVLTNNDKKIANYIKNNMESIIKLTSVDLAKNTKLSQSAITRFVKKIGYNSFIDMKVDLAKSNDKDFDYIEDEINKDDDIENIIEKSKTNIIKTIEKTYGIIEVDKVKKASCMLNNANKIYLSGVAGSGLICEDFYYKLLRAGANVTYEKDTHTNISIISHIKKDDLLIAISYNAKTKEVIEAVEYAKSKEAGVISISKNENSKLSKLSDVLLKIPSIEKELRYGAIGSRFSSLAITDILYFSYITKNYENTKESLVTSKKLTDRLK